MVKLLAWGAEAELYEAEVLGIKAVVKRRIEKKYRVKELDEKLRRTRTRIEARVLSEAKKTGVRVPAILELNDYEITMEFVQGKLLRNELQTKNKNISHIISLAGHSLASLHNSNIVHGDFTPANIIVSKNNPVIIDFGLGGFSREIEDKAVDVLLMKKALADKKLYDAFARAYSRNAANASAILKQLEEIEKRGRYVVRAMTK